MTRELDDLSDAELIDRAREGDTSAYGVLWKRHWNAGRAMAASVTGRFEPDDLASEAFARILKSIEKGSGPRTGFRSYLATTVRNVAIDWSRRKTTPNIEDPDVVEDWTYSELTALERIERKTVADAFYALPDSWQEVLWYTVVEDMAPRDVAPLLGLTPNAVSALSARAREGLRQTWINAHLAEGDLKDPAHNWTIKKLGPYVRGRLSKADHRRVVAHLDQCEACSNAASEADQVGSRLALGILPLFLGIAGATAYSAWTTGRSGGAVAATLPGAVGSADAWGGGSAGGSGSGVGAHGLGGSGLGGSGFGGSALRHLLHSATSGSGIGVATVAASVIAAAALTATVAGTPSAELPTAQTESRPTAHDPSAQRPEEVVDPEMTAPAASPERSLPPATTPPRRPVGEGADPSPVDDVAPTAPKETPEGRRSPLPDPSEPTPTPEPSPTLTSTPTPAPTPMPTPAPTPTPTPPPTPSPTPEPTPTPTPSPTPEPTPTPTPAPTPTPSPAPGGCAAAVRAIPAADTLFAYLLGDPDGTTTATDIVHGLTARYDAPRAGTGWALSDGVLRTPTDVFTLQIWFRTDDGGGRLLGFSNTTSGLSSYYDRHLFLTDDGRLAFGVFPDAVQTIASTATYTDGEWHQATATLSGAGMALYVDGERVASDTSVVQAQDFEGFWRIGMDNLDNWGPETPSIRAFPGSLAFAAVYTTALTPDQVETQWKLCR